MKSGRSRDALGPRPGAPARGSLGLQRGAPRPATASVVEQATWPCGDVTAPSDVEPCRRCPRRDRRSASSGRVHHAPSIDGRESFADGRRPICPQADALTEDDRDDEIQASLRALLGERTPPQREVAFDEGRVGLLFCAQCGDLGCGAVTAGAAFTADTVGWRSIAYQNGQTGELSSDPPPRTVIFDRSQYEATIRRLLSDWTERSSADGGLRAFVEGRANRALVATGNTTVAPAAAVRCSACHEAPGTGVLNGVVCDRSS